MIRILRWPLSPPPVQPRAVERIVPRLAGRNYTCTSCDVRGFGTQCWCCGEAVQ